MEKQNVATALNQAHELSTPRAVTYRAGGHRHGPITRLMSPSDVGEMLKPFIFLANRATMDRHGAKFIIVHGQHEVREGDFRPSITVVEFPSYRAAFDCYNDPIYKEAAKTRHSVAEGNMTIVEGFDEPVGF